MRYSVTRSFAGVRVTLTFTSERPSDVALLCDHTLGPDPRTVCLDAPPVSDEGWGCLYCFHDAMMLDGWTYRCAGCLRTLVWFEVYRKKAVPKWLNKGAIHGFCTIDRPPTQSSP